MTSSKASVLNAVGERLQAIALGSLIGMLQRLGPVPSSNLGGWVARTIGPWLAVSRVAHSNLQLALPELDEVRRAGIVRAVWDNLGRTCAELPYLATFARTDAGPGWELLGAEHIEGLRDSGAQALYFSGHFGNWEMVLPIASQLGMPVAGFYRAASNRRVDHVIQALRARAVGARSPMFAKGSSGARAALRHLQGGGSLGLLVDQKMNDGIPVPFFGRTAMTAPALAQFALRYRCPIIPVHVLRLGPARFRMVCEAPLAVPQTGSSQSDIQAITGAMNATLERWIRADPEAWLWLHRRWPKAPATGR